MYAEAHALQEARKAQCLPCDGGSPWPMAAARRGSRDPSPHRPPADPAEAGRFDARKRSGSLVAHFGSEQRSVWQLSDVSLENLAECVGGGGSHAESGMLGAGGTGSGAGPGGLRAIDWSGACDEHEKSGERKELHAYELVSQMESRIFPKTFGCARSRRHLESAPPARAANQLKTSSHTERCTD